MQALMTKGQAALGLAARSAVARGQPLNPLRDLVASDSLEWLGLAVGREELGGEAPGFSRGESPHISSFSLFTKDILQDSTYMNRRIANFYE